MSIKTGLGLMFIVAGTMYCSPSKNKVNDCVAKENPECVCTMQYDPVCGCDGKTYSNACMAGCAEIAVVSKGACP